ncbi:MAG: IMP dehydrogenase [bacterium]|nr:IMP dehydrogenase [bacterium]
MGPEEADQLVQKYFKRKGLPLMPAVTFDDVLVREGISSIASRSDITNLKAQLAKDFWLNIPVVSANMDTVTDSRMAIALARLGGMGFIHQFVSLEDRLEEVSKVKRADNMVIENPATIRPEATWAEAQAVMAEREISCLLVTDAQGILAGILTSRDTQFCSDPNALVGDLMTPKTRDGHFVLQTARPDISNEDAEKMLKRSKVEKLPLIDDEGKVVGLITAKDILKRRMFPNAARDEKGQLLVGATLRFSGNYLEEAKALIDAGADVLLLDTARASSSSEDGILASQYLTPGKIVELAAERTAKIKYVFPKIVLVVGNTANPEAVALLASRGADCVKIGIGPGAGCKTQEVAGIGSPQLHAIAQCAAVAREIGVCLMADGGIRNGGCMVKALVGGANVVMLGSLLAGTDKSPGLLVWNRKENKLVKKYRGSASTEHQLDRIKVGDLHAVRTSEGEAGAVPYMGTTVSLIDDLLGGLRSGMSYVGAHNLEELWQFGRFVWRTQAGIEEGRPRI